ncbi:MAG: tRNA methyl transferase PRC-barrel domain-containing protein, partial [Verrucomicrobiota bacterium]
MRIALLGRRGAARRVLGWVFAGLWAVIGPEGRAADLVIWHSQPVRPGQSVLLYGDGLEQATVEGRRLDDAAAGLPGGDPGPAAGPSATAWTVLQPRRHALKVVVPPEASPGVFALTVTSGGRRQEVRVNAPEVWWARGAEKEICFIPDNDYVRFLEANGIVASPGEIVTTDGRVVGRHAGLHRYTIGQRKGLGIAW